MANKKNQPQNRNKITPILIAAGAAVVLVTVILLLCLPGNSPTSMAASALSVSVPRSWTPIPSPSILKRQSKRSPRATLNEKAGVCSALLTKRHINSRNADAFREFLFVRVKFFPIYLKTAQTCVRIFP